MTITPETFSKIGHRDCALFIKIISIIVDEALASMCLFEFTPGLRIGVPRIAYSQYKFAPLINSLRCASRGTGPLDFIEYVILGKAGVTQFQGKTLAIWEEWRNVYTSTSDYLIRDNSQILQQTLSCLEFWYCYR